jgi:hypothetical protein
MIKAKRRLELAMVVTMPKCNIYGSSWLYPEMIVDNKCVYPNKKSVMIVECEVALLGHKR